MNVVADQHGDREDAACDGLPLGAGDAVGDR